MNLVEFVRRYSGVAVDFDKAYGAQCVDLIRQYFKDVWALPRQPEGVDGAEEFYFKHDSRPVQKGLCICTAYDGRTWPPKGSVVIFKGHSKNQYGHIGICLDSFDDCLDVFEQDGVANAALLKAGLEQKGAYISRWKYDRLVGWLTKREAA
jgi:hypothetical protein